ncbi:MAG: peptide ABC transporter substrate-binding protein [Lachnospiraceae bacterium]|nr:peptide ABC transporter substrate-binding protein [Lachnospiraceae bacterium]
MKRVKKLTAALLVVLMVSSLAACGKKTVEDTTPTPTQEQQPGGQENTPTPETKKPVILTDDDAIYDAALSEYAEYLEKAHAEVKNVSLRYTLEAIAEAKLMESAVYIPGSSDGGNYGIGRVAPYTASPCLWGNDSYRYHQVIVVKGNPIKPADRDALKAKWVEVKGTGTYEAYVKQYLTEKGYTIKDTYTIGYSSDPATWDIFDTYLAADARAIINTFDNLIEYDLENVMKPAIAENWTVSDDGLTYTFKIRQGVKWVDSQGRYIADVTAEDFVTGMQHCLDCEQTSYLVEGVIKGATEYLDGTITDFAQVGVKATDAYTLVYTLEQPTPYFMSMMAYNPFAPLNKNYFISQGGALGRDKWAEAYEAGVNYGIDKDHIAYCGPYLVTNATDESKIVFSANPTYWNKDNINIKTITWLYNDGKDSTKAYNDMKAEVIDSCGLNTEALALAKADGWFDEYHFVSGTDATAYGSFLNLYRQAYALFNDETAAVSGLTDEQKDLANLCMQNVHFRRAFAFAYDRIAYNAQVVGEEVAPLSVINSYTPGNFVQLTEDVTVSINGTNQTFKAGTYYGEIMQAQINADGVPMKVWDPTLEAGAGSSAGFDGWFNPANAVAELKKAAEELGITIDKDHPVHIELSYASSNAVYANRANALKKSVETSTDGAIIVDLLDCVTLKNWYYDGYYTQSGSQCNYNVYDVSGWSPDYGDPQTYLNTFQKEIGDMIHVLGIY